MKKNVILSTVAATVVTGVLMLSGCGATHTAETPVASHTAVGQINVVVDAAGNVKTGATTTAQESNGGNLGGGFSKTTATVTSVTGCHDANNVSKPCAEVCTTATPCNVTVKATCLADTDTATGATNADGKLNYANLSDNIGAWHVWNNSGDTNVQAVIADPANLVPAYSGIVYVTGTGMTTCGFDFSTFVVCALTKDGTHAWNTSTNSAGYVMVLVEYKDGTKEWKKVNIQRKPNGEIDDDGKPVTDQPFVELLGLKGKVPAKITVFSVLLKGKPATGATGSTGAGTL